MSLRTNHFYEFENFRLDVAEKSLFVDGQPIQLTPKVFELLNLFVQNAGHLLTKDELIKNLWNDRFVEESNLTFNISTLRKILNDNAQSPRFIETVPRHGYRFIAKVKENFPQNPEPAKSFRFSANNIDLKVEDGSFSENGFSTNSQIPKNNPEEIFPKLPKKNVSLSNSGFYLVSTGILITIVLAIVFFVWDRTTIKSSEKRFPAQYKSGLENSRFKFEPIVQAQEDTKVSVISPDGKNIAFTNTVNGQHILWIRQLSSGVNTRLLALTDDSRIADLDFSQDGESVYFVSKNKNTETKVSRISIFGGAVTTVFNDLDTAFALSPDGKQFSFAKVNNNLRQLMIADIDGKNVRTIFESSSSNYITDSAWSPDGKTIAFALGQPHTGDKTIGIYTFDVETGKIENLNESQFYWVSKILWLPDKTGLLMTGQTDFNDLRQVWKVSYPSGEVKKITGSQNNLTGLSGTEDCGAILLTQSSVNAELYVAPTEKPDNLISLGQVIGSASWSPDGKLFYDSGFMGNNSVWTMNADGTNPGQLTAGKSSDINPRVSPDGKYVVFTSDRTGKFNLWRMDIDGSNLIQLTNGNGETSPDFTPDGQNIIFVQTSDFSLWKISISGGEPTQLSPEKFNSVSISPDGTKFVYSVSKNNRDKILIRSLSDLKILQEFDYPVGQSNQNTIIWRKDGRSFIYSAKNPAGIENLWEQSLDTGDPKKLSNFSSGEIYGLSISPDNSQLALVRGAIKWDLVLMKLSE